MKALLRSPLLRPATLVRSHLTNLMEAAMAGRQAKLLTELMVTLALRYVPRGSAAERDVVIIRRRNAARRPPACIK